MSATDAPCVRNFRSIITPSSEVEHGLGSKINMLCGFNSETVAGMNEAASGIALNPPWPRLVRIGLGFALRAPVCVLINPACSKARDHSSGRLNLSEMLSRFAIAPSSRSRPDRMYRNREGAGSRASRIAPGANHWRTPLRPMRLGSRCKLSTATTRSNFPSSAV